MYYYNSYFYEMVGKTKFGE